LFFNELKLGATESDTASYGTLFAPNQINPGTTDKIVPLSPDDQNGAFVMILSTNASSVTNTIGQFAESRVVAEAVTNLANKDLLRSDAKKQTEDVNNANAIAQEVDKLMELVPSVASPDANQTTRAYLRVINAIAAGIDGHTEGFNTFDDAQDWFDSVKGD